MLTSIAGVLGSGMKGYADGRRQYEEDEFKKEQQNRQRQAWKDEDALKAGLKDAAKPIEVENGETYQPAVDDEGNAMPANPTAGTYKAGGQRYSSMTDAQSAADKANTPEAQAARMADAYAKAGKPTEAMQLRASAKQSKLAEFQLSKAENDFLDEKFNRELETLFAENGGALKGIAAYYTKSELGGASGKKFVVRDTPDGKQSQIWMIDQNGNEQVYKSFPAGERGEALARNELLKVDPKTKMTFLYDVSKTMKAEGLAEGKQVLDERRVSADEVRAEAAAKNAETQARRLDAVLSGAGRQSAGGAKGGGEGQQGGVTMEAVDKVLGPLYTSKDELTGATKADTTAHEFVRKLALRMPSAQVGDSAGAALQAHNIYQAELKLAGGDHRKAVASIVSKASAPAAEAPAAAPSMGAAAAPATAPAAAPKKQTPLEMSMAVSPDADDEAYVKQKLMGRFDGPNKLTDIAANNPNPRFRAAAKRMLDAQQQTNAMPSMTGLGL